MKQRVVIIGGDAAGMTAAGRVRGGASDAEVVALEMGRFTSYSACGIPYAIGGLVAGGVERLVARSPEQHRQRGVDVRLHHEATAIDTAAGTVEVLDQHAGETYQLGYDQLMVATGGAPIRPSLPGIDLPFIQGVQTLGDAERLLALAEDGCRRVVIVGGGYIGLEMAEAFIERGCSATIVERGAQPLALLDEDFGARIAAALRQRGIDVRTETTVEGFAPQRVITDGGELPADLVVLGIGVRPRSELAAAAGIELGVQDAIRVDDRQATSVDGVWSAGDCATAVHVVTGAPVHIPLGTYANKHGRVAGLNIARRLAGAEGAGDDARALPVAGTAVTKLCKLEIGLTGLRQDTAIDAGLDAVTVTIEATTQAGYMPGARPMTVRMTAERGTGRLLGAQILGGPGAAKRIDVVATALAAGMTVADVAELDLGYAPPFSGVWDPVAVAAREATKEV